MQKFMIFTPKNRREPHNFVTAKLLNIFYTPKQKKKSKIVFAHHISRANAKNLNGLLTTFERTRKKTHLVDFVEKRTLVGEVSKTFIYLLFFCRKFCCLRKGTEVGKMIPCLVCKLLFMIQCLRFTRAQNIT